MRLLTDVHTYVRRHMLDWRDSDYEVADKVNAMTNYEFLELLDAVFEEAVKEITR